MKLFTLLTLSAVAASPAFAQETRHLGAHEHGVTQLDLAIDGQKVAMVLHAPGADIVGFEYAAESAEDLAAIESAVTTLGQPLDLFLFPDTADCHVITAEAELESEGAHDEDHDEDHDDDHDDEHGDHDDDHDDDHAEEDHDAHDEHDEDHDEHEAGHTEFHAEYLLECANPEALTEMTFAYFDTFPNAVEVEVQAVADSGATAFEVERDAPTLDLSDLF